MNNIEFKSAMLSYLYTVSVGGMFCIGGWLTDQQIITWFGNGMIYGGIVLIGVQSLLSYQHRKIEKRKLEMNG
jgi:hypothetical protein